MRSVIRGNSKWCRGRRRWLTEKISPIPHIMYTCFANVVISHFLHLFYALLLFAYDLRAWHPPRLFLWDIFDFVEMSNARWRIEPFDKHFRKSALEELALHGEKLIRLDWKLSRKEKHEISWNIQTHAFNRLTKPKQICCYRIFTRIHFPVEKSKSDLKLKSPLVCHIQTDSEFDMNGEQVNCADITLTQITLVQLWQNRVANQ